MLMRLHREADIHTDAAKGFLVSGSKSLARFHISRRKIAHVHAERIAGIVIRLDDMYHSVESAGLNSDIMDVFKASLAALKASRLTDTDMDIIDETGEEMEALTSDANIAFGDAMINLDDETIQEDLDLLMAEMALSATTKLPLLKPHVMEDTELEDIREIEETRLLAM